MVCTHVVCDESTFCNSVTTVCSFKNCEEVTKFDESGYGRCARVMRDCIKRNYGRLLALTLGTLTGQVADYMQKYRLRYSYLTTYNELLLLRQRFDNSKGFVLEYSPVFHFDTTSSDFTMSMRDKQDHVSLREALFFITWRSIKDDQEKGFPRKNQERTWLRDVAGPSAPGPGGARGPKSGGQHPGTGPSSDGGKASAPGPSNRNQGSGGPPQRQKTAGYVESYSRDQKRTHVGSEYVQPCSYPLICHNPRHHPADSDIRRTAPIDTVNKRMSDLSIETGDERGLSRPTQRSTTLSKGSHRTAAPGFYVVRQSDRQAPR